VLWRWRDIISEKSFRWQIQDTMSATELQQEEVQHTQHASRWCEVHQALNFKEQPRNRNRTTTEHCFRSSAAPAANFHSWRRPVACLDLKREAPSRRALQRGKQHTASCAATDSTVAQPYLPSPKHHRALKTALQIHAPGSCSTFCPQRKCCNVVKN
jgi:hypothetical protein